MSTQKDTPGTAPLERLLSIAEVADKLNVSSMSVRRLLESGQLTGVRVGARRRLVEPGEVRRYLERRREREGP